MARSKSAAHQISLAHVVRGFAAAVGIVALAQFAWSDESAPLIKRLDDPTRAKVLAALAALVMLGFAMVVLTWLGARIVHRYRHGASYFRPTIRPSEHEWAKKPLTPSDPNPPTSDV